MHFILQSSTYQPYDLNDLHKDLYLLNFFPRKTWSSFSKTSRRLQSCKHAKEWTFQNTFSLNFCTKSSRKIYLLTETSVVIKIIVTNFQNKLITTVKQVKECTHKQRSLNLNDTYVCTAGGK